MLSLLILAVFVAIDLVQFCYVSIKKVNEVFWVHNVFVMVFSYSISQKTKQNKQKEKEKEKKKKKKKNMFTTCVHANKCWYFRIMNVLNHLQCLI